MVAGTELKKFIANQYQMLFVSNTGGQMEEVSSCVQRRVTNDMNDILLAPIFRG